MQKLFLEGGTIRNTLKTNKEVGRKGDMADQHGNVENISQEKDDLDTYLELKNIDIPYTPPALLTLPWFFILFHLLLDLFDLICQDVDAAGEISYGQNSSHDTHGFILKETSIRR